MAGRRGQSLVLDVSANVGGLKTSVQAGKTALLELERSAVSVEQAVTKAFSDMGGGGPAAAAQQADREFNKMFKSIAANARAIKAETSGAFALKLFDVAAADEQVRVLQQNAAHLRTLSAGLEVASANESEFSAKQRQAAVAALTHAQALEQEALEIDQTASALRAGITNLGARDAALVRSTQVSGQARAGLQQLSFQLNDVAVQYAAGTPPMTIFAQQSGQVIQAVQLMSGEAKGFLGVLAGPWGIAIVTATTVLAPLIAKSELFNQIIGNGSSKLQENAKQLDEVKAGSDGLSEAQSALGDMFDINTGKIKKNTEALQANATAAALKMQADALAAQSSSEKTMTFNAGGKLGLSLVEKVQGAVGINVNSSVGQAEQVQAVFDRLKAGKIGAGAAEKELYKLQDAFSGLSITLKDAIQAVIDYSSAPGLLKTAEAMLKSVDSGRLDPSLVKRDTKSTGASVAQQASMGDMVALIEQIFHGARITSTTGGQHTKGSDHYAGRAIDFVIPGMMNPEGTKKVQAALDAAGVDIRRNAKGTLQFFGPGRSASKPGDHNDHFHVAWEGSVDPERAAANMARTREMAQDKSQRQADTFGQEQLQLAQQLVQAKRQNVTSADQAAQLELEAIDAERIKVNAGYRAAEAEGKIAAGKANELIISNDLVAAEKSRSVVSAERARKLDRQLRLDNEDLDNRISVLRLQSQFADTLDERRRISLQILELELQERRNKAKRLQESTNQDDQAEGRRLEAQLDQEAPVLRRQVEQESASPVEQYLERLRKASGDSKTALQEVEVDGLNALEEGLVGLISGTESVASAFKKMANTIIADLARIAIEKLIVSVIGGGGPGGFLSSLFGHATGDVPGFAAGLITGPGTGTSDSILAWHESQGPIRVSNGESIITAAGTRKHASLLHAINAGLPAFATGHVPSLARLPASGLGSRSGREVVTIEQHFHVDAKGSVLASELVGEMHRIGATAAVAGAKMAEQGMTDQQMGQLA